MLRKLLMTAVALVWIWPASEAIAAEPERVELSPMALNDAQLTLASPDGKSTTYTSETLETLPTYALVTTTPWRDTPARFEGVLLIDLLRAHDLAQGDIVVFAENGFQATIEKRVFDAVPILVATRVDGAPHTRRARGPIQFVIHHDDYKDNRDVEERHLIWMAARIEAAG